MPKSISPYKETNAAIAEALHGKPSGPSDEISAPMLQQLLQFYTDNDKMTASAWADIMKFLDKEKKVKGVCDLSKLNYHRLKPVGCCGLKAAVKRLKVAVGG